MLKGRFLKCETKEQKLYLAVCLVFALCVIVMHFLIHPGTSDDQASLELTRDFTLTEWVIWRFNSWSARWIQEAIGYILIRNHLLWRVLDAILWIVLPFLLNYLIDAEGHERYAVFFLIAVYPFAEFTSAGWVCTTITYFWPVFFGLVFFSLLKKRARMKRLSVFEYIVLFLSLIVSVNHELFAALALMILLFLSAYLYYSRKKISLLLSVCELIAITDIMVVLLSPGNRSRAVVEMAAVNADYAGYSVVHKLYIGFLRLVDILLDEQNAIFAVLCILLVIGGIACSKQLVAVVQAALLAIILFGFGYVIRFYKIKEVWEFDRMSLQAYIPVVLGVVTFTAVCILLWMIFGEDRERFTALLALTVFLGGLATTGVMGFSPTIYMSGKRTSTFTCFAVLYIALLVYRKLNRSLNLWKMHMAAFWITVTAAAGGYDFWMIYALDL